MTIHDLNFMERADYPNWRKNLKAKRLQQKINRCHGLVYVSEFVKNEVHAHLQVSASMAEKVIYNGVQVGAETKGGAKTRQKPYLFSIGLHPKKNYGAALPILKDNPDYQWVIAGADAKGYKAVMEKSAQELGVADQLAFTGTVTEEEKWRLYQNCAALIFPSLSEGFGLPVLEAMAYGKPVFLSDRTSLPEIGGKEAYYFKNFEPAHISHVFSEGLKAFKDDPGKAQRLKDYAANFNWQSAAKEYLKFYDHLLNN